MPSQGTAKFPERASTQFWMMSTFALFVGIAVVIVGLYALVALRDRLEEDAFDQLLDQAQRVETQLERANDANELRRTAVQASRIIGGRVTIARADSVVTDVEDGQPVSDPLVFFEVEEVQEALAGGIGEARRVDDQGRPALYVAYRVPGSDRLVRIGRYNPPLYRLIRRMQFALFASSVLGLALALLGSWIASKRIIRPLQTLTENARRISEGKIDEELEVHSRASEFQDLSNSLHVMAERFRDDIDELQHLVRLQNEFLGDVSHEVRNPIFAISGYLEALGSGSLPPNMRQRYAQKGTANLQRLSNLFSDLVDIARLEYRKDLIHPEIFDLREMLEDIVEIARSEAADKGLSIDMVMPAGVMEVVGDRNRLRQVLTNLVENAIAYTDAGKIAVRYWREGDRVHIEVEDSGKGISEEHQERVFDRFYRVDPARSRKSGGSGLGLSIVKQILHAHDQPIHLESTIGEGSRFWFAIPHGSTGEWGESEEDAGATGSKELAESEQGERA